MPDWEPLVRERLGGPLARRGELVRELADFLEDVYEEGLAKGDNPAEASARALNAAGDWSALRRRVEGEEVEMRARRVIGVAAATTLAAIILGGLGWWGARHEGALPPIVTSGGRPWASPDEDARTLGTGSAEARKVAVSPPSGPVPELVALLESPSAMDRAEAARQLAGAPALSHGAAATLLHLQREDPDEAVRLAATRAVALLQHAEVMSAGASTGKTGEPPRVIEITRPEYPREAFEAKLEGTVALLLLIDEQGEVAQVEVRESIPGLDGAALACARDWKFRPARDEGRPVPAAAIAPVSFRIY